MADSSVTNEIRAFFEKYNAAFLTRDGKLIANCYHAPTVTMRGDGSIHCLASRDELAKFFQGVVDGYAKEGLGGGRFSNLQVTPLGDRSALATLDWDMLRTDGSVLLEVGVSPTTWCALIQVGRSSYPRFMFRVRKLPS
jgi:hypothetical protein